MLNQLCDSTHLYQTFKNDFDVHARLAPLGATDLNLEVLGETADALGLTTDFSSPESTAHCTRLTANLRAAVQHVYSGQNAKI